MEEKIDAVSKADDSEFPHRKPGQSRLDYLIAVSAFTAPRMKGSPTYEEIMNELYDPETGLPW